MALDIKSKTFLVYIAALKVLLSGIIIYFSQKIQVEKKSD